MKEEQERLLRYIGEIFEKRRLEKTQSHTTSNEEADIINYACKRIRKIREHKGITVEQLSEKTGLIVPYIEQIEIGTANPYMTEIYEISKALGVEVSELFTKK